MCKIITLGRCKIQVDRQTKKKQSPSYIKWVTVKMKNGSMYFLYFFGPAVKWKSNIKDFKTKQNNNRIIITKKNTAPTRPITLFRYFKKKKAIAWRTEFLVLRYCPFFPVRNYENPKTVKFR